MQQYSWLICCHHLAGTPYTKLYVTQNLIRASSWYHNMTESWKQSSFHLMVAHTQFKKFQQVSICAFPQDLQSRFSHFFFMFLSSHFIFWVKYTVIPPSHHKTARQPSPRTLNLSSLSFSSATRLPSTGSVLWSKLLISEAGLPFSRGRQWKYTRHDSDGWLAVSSLP